MNSTLVVTRSPAEWAIQRLQLLRRQRVGSGPFRVPHRCLLHDPGILGNIHERQWGALHSVRHHHVPHAFRRGEHGTTHRCLD